VHAKLCRGAGAVARGMAELDAIAHREV
jgi:hypothetical protein